MLLLLNDCLQGVAGFGDLRQVDLGALLFLRDPGARFTTSALVLLQDVLAYANGLIFLDGAGVRLLLGDTDLGQHLEDGPALYFQLSSQIINSNLHPPVCFLRGIRQPSKIHSNLTVPIFTGGNLSCRRRKAQFFIAALYRRA